MAKRKKIGLALGSGGARGIAHAGVIKVLEGYGIPIDYIAGASSGAIVGGLYASFDNSVKLEKVVLSATWKQVISLLDPKVKKGLIGGSKLIGFIREQMGDPRFKDLEIPFIAIATDLEDGEVVKLKKGNVADAIHASAAFPLVFTPIEIDGKLLADGGMSMPVPVQAVRDMGADIVIAVNLDGNYFSERKKKSKWGYTRIANSSVNMLRYHLAQHDIKEADIVIEPKTGRIYWNKLMNGQDVFEAGMKAAEKSIKEIKKSLR